MIATRERWVFLLLLVWLVFAAAQPGPWGRTLAAALLVVDLVTAAVPGLTYIGPRWRARAVEAVVDDGDLVVFPGHDWDECIGFYDERNIRVFALTYFVAAFGWTALSASSTTCGLRGRGGQVWLVRVLDDDPGAATRGSRELIFHAEHR